MQYSTVYIDESGDLGYGAGTRWFVLSAVIVDKEKEKSIRQRLNQIKSRIKVDEIHLRKISDFYRRSYLVRELSDQEFIYINIVADTDKFDRTRSVSPIIAYNYLCRLLLERVSWYLRDNDRIADVMLSARGTSRDGELIRYISDKLLPASDNQIAKGVFRKISAKPANSWNLLQLADVCATTTFLAYEVKKCWGFRMPCYFMALKNHIYRYKGKLINYGIKYFPEEIRLEPEEMDSNYCCKAKERTSGATAT